jgi:FkbM family methyltransferase
MYEIYDWTNVSRRRNDLTRSYEPIQIDILRSLARVHGDCVFLDIGANIGVYSLLIGGDKSVREAIAFEPVPDLADELEKNILINRLAEKITVRRVVLSDFSGSTDFLIRSKYAGDGGVVETHLFTDLPYDRIEKFEKRTLDDELSLVGMSIVGKVDVEGHELNVLHGARSLLSNNKGFLQIEFLTDELEIAGRSFLESVGWKQIFKIDRDIYFSNYQEYRDAESNLKLLEHCMAQFVLRSRNLEGVPSRKRVTPNIVFELTGAPERFVRQLWRLIRRRA